MPTKFHSYDCEHRAGSWSAAPTCPACGARGSFAFWSLSMHEAMARYQYVHGLKPVGPHRKLAEKLLGPHRARCSQCDGAGLVWSADGRTYRVCGVCEGTGGFWTCSEEALQHARQQVIDQYPDAAAPRRPIPFLSGGLIQNLRTGEMLHADDSGMGE